MDQQTLKSFRQQLHKWTEQRLNSGRYPFRRIEQLPAVFCASGIEIPDLVLWINRDSCLAGGIILLTSSKDTSCVQRGSNIAKALGLENFVVWGAHDVTIWSNRQQTCQKLETLSLATLQLLAPCDFEQILGQLLSRLKMLAVTGSVAASELPPHFFANLCNITLQNVLPGQTEASRMAADGTQPDTWAATIPRHKVWLSLWRLLFLLDKDLLPRSLQPHRLEDAMRYALADLAEREYAGFAIENIEPALTEEASVVFHQLANRLQQLRWSADPGRAAKTVEILLKISAESFMVQQELPPWPLASIDLAVNICLPAQIYTGVQVAPKTYLAGWNLLAGLTGREEVGSQAYAIYQLDCEASPSKTIAHLEDTTIPSAMERDRRLVALREVWPNHRFHLPRDTPTWLWEALHLSGLAASPGQLHLSLPADWAFAPGAAMLWAYLLKKRQLLSYGQTEEGFTLLRLEEPLQDDTLQLMRGETPLSVSGELFRACDPSVIHCCLKCDQQVLDFIMDEHLRPLHAASNIDCEKIAKQAFLFCHTTIGRHLWQLQLGQKDLPNSALMAEVLCSLNLLLPAPDVLGAFALLDWQPGQTVPDQSRLNRILHSCWGKLPDIHTAGHEQAERKTDQLNRQKLRKEIADVVFVDGLPLFPEHYLMHHYRPELCSFSIPGPLEHYASFFNRIFLRTTDGTEIELDNEPTAQALLILSSMNRQKVELPTDVALMEEILSQYRFDLEKLWKALLRESRRRIPVRQQAISAARKIWRDHNLPPRNTFVSPRQE